MKKLALGNLVGIVAAMTLVSPYVASAQQTTTLVPQSEVSAAFDQQNVPAKAQDAEDKVASVVKRFGVGVEAGVGFSPQVIDFGGHATFGPILNPRVQFRPGVEFSFGEVTTTFAINLDVLYTFAAANGQPRWSPYLGAGPTFGLSHRGFSATTDDTGNRLDFSDTSFDAGLNFVGGVRNRAGTFVEVRATAWGVANVRLLAGFNF